MLRGVGVEMRLLNEQAPLDRLEIVEAVGPYTMTDRDRIVALCDAVEYVVESGIEGSFVECGVWRGGSMMAVAMTLLDKGVSDRQLFLFDTFDGMVEPSEHDRDFTGVDARAAWASSSPRPTGSDWCCAPMGEVRDAMISTGYPMENVHLIKGRVEDTLPQEKPGDIAILRVDVDWYEATAHILKHLTDCIVNGGVVLFDDYVYWDGARKAVDEWVARWQHPVFLSRVGGWGRMCVVNRCSPSDGGRPHI